MYGPRKMADEIKESPRGRSREVESKEREEEFDEESRQDVGPQG